MKKTFWVILLSLILSVCVFAACENECKEHSFGAWTVTKEATCTTAGKESRECEKCGETETREIAALGHSFTNYESNSDATCTSDGTMTAQCDHGCGKPHTVTDEGSSFGHSYGEWISNGDGTHTKTCANDATHKVIESCHGGEATCTTKAICDDCNAEYGELGHSFTNYESNNDATCEADGTKTAYCDHGCGEHDTITDEGTVLGHTYGAWISNGDETHTKTCANDSTHTVTESCHGGEATCTERAICDDCKAEYGGVKHIVDNSGWCTICDLSASATKGVEYAISDDNTYASVVGYNGSSTRVRIADSYSGLPVIAINSGAFKLTAITEVIIPSSVTSIGNSAFGGCSGLTSITIPDSVTSMGSSVFGGCSKLTSVTIGNGVTSIGYEAFYNCSSLSKVTIPSSVTSIGNVAFYNCSNLTSVTIPDSVISIGVGAFWNCSSLTSITIPSSVTIIEYDAFKGCDNLAYNEYDNAYYLGNDENPYLVLIKAKSTSITSCTINEKTKFVHSSAFKGCGSLTSITMPNSVTSIGSSAFFVCSSLTAVYISDIAAWCNISFENAYSNPLLCAKNLYLNNELVTDLVIPDSVTSIGSYAFGSCDSLTNVTIPDSVTSIGDNAFGNCDSLTNVTIPDSVTNIGRSVFSTCYNLTYNEYDNAYYLGNSENPYVVLVEAESESIKACTINENTKVICDSAFYECSNLTSITIPSRVTSIGDKAFYECSNLTSVSIGNSVTSIGSYAFYNCSRLSKVTIPDSATSIGNSAFYGCSSLTSLTIGNGITSIQNGVFGNCSRLSKVTIPDSVTSIEYGAFYNCGSLTSITIGNGVKSIVQDAFSACSKLTSVYYKGSESEWKGISIDNSNNDLTSATKYYYSESNPFEGENAVESGDYWHYDTDGKTIVVWKKQ